jgi:hypothetical protein
MNAVNTPATSLAERLVAFAECGPGDAYYRLSRVVARVLVSRRLRQRKKWCDLARQLAQNPGVEDRLVMQAMRWLDQRPSVAIYDASSTRPPGQPPPGFIAERLKGLEK